MSQFMVNPRVIILFLLLLLVWTVPVSAAPAPGGDERATAAGEGYEQSHLMQVALLSERHLSQALELPPSDQFALDEAVAAADDFDLVLPEEDLPESDFPLTFNAKVEYFIRYFQSSGRKSFSKWLSRSERYIPMMREILRKEGLPEDLVYLAMIESGFAPHAFSVASAVGPWQFMSGTGKRYDLRIDPWIDERRDPIKSTVAAALYLKELYAMFNNDWYLAAAGYNAGENKILRAINMYNSRDFWQLSKGGYLKRETKDYVPKLLAAAIIAKEPAKYGFADVAYLPAIELDTVKIPSKTDLELVASICGNSYQEIRDLNPELRRWSTPPDYPDYELKIPKGKKELFEAEFAKIPEEKRYTEKLRHVRYKAKRNDTLASVARRFGTTPQTIIELNNIGRSKKIKGKVLTIPVQIAAVDKNQSVAPVQESAALDKKTYNKYYTVKRGDTLSSLARKFKVSATFLTAWNNLKAKVALRPGKKIIIAKFVERNGQMVNIGAS
jgi:membrane-bound lytic murein transglycosylase D